MTAHHGSKGLSLLQTKWLSDHLKASEPPFQITESGSTGFKKFSNFALVCAVTYFHTIVWNEWNKLLNVCNSFYSEPILRKCLSVPPLPTEWDKPMQRENLPALSSLDLHGNYWETYESTSSSSASSHHNDNPHIAPSSPQQICFFVSSQDEPLSHVQQ